MQKTDLINKSIGIVGVIISIILIINFYDLVVFLTDLSEKYLSKDNSVSPKTVFILKFCIVTILVFLITLSLLFILDLTRKIFPFIFSFFQISNQLTTNICSKKRLDLYILVIGTVLGIYQIYYLLTFGETFDEFAKPLTLPEGTLEKFYALLLLISIIILIISILRIKKELYSPRLRRKIIYSISLISGILLLILGEEISWGQQIFGWDSIDFFNEHSYQNETNVHNLINPFMKYIYIVVGVGLFIVLFIIWLFPKKRESYFFNLIFPHPSLFFLVLIMAFSSFSGGGGETFEQLFTIFALLYCFRLFMCLSFPGIEKSYQEI